MVIQYSTLKKLKLAAKRSRKTRKTARKTRKTARKTRRKTRKMIRRKTVKKAKKRPTKRNRSTKSSNVKHDTDIGTLALRQYVNAKRKAKQDEIKEYERKYLARYKEPKAKKKAASSNLYKPEKPKPKRDMKKERKEYEQKYLTRYNKQQKAKPKKKNNSI